MHRLKTCMTRSDAMLRFSTSWVTGKSAGKRTPHVIKPGRFPKFVHLHCSNVNWPRLLCFFSHRPHQWSGFLGLAQQCLGMNGTFRGLLTGICVLPHMRSVTLFSKRGFKWKQDAQTIRFDPFLFVSRSEAMGQVLKWRWALHLIWFAPQTHQYNLQHVFEAPSGREMTVFMDSSWIIVLLLLWKAKPNHNVSALPYCARRVNTFPGPHPVGMFDIERKA